MRRSLLLAAALLAALAPGAASAQTADAPIPLAAFADSARLHAALAAAPPAPPEFKRRLLLTVVFDTLAGAPEVEVVGPRFVPAAYADSMASLLRAHLTPQPARPELRVQTLWLRSGSDPRIEVVELGVEIRPELANRRVIGGELERSARALVSRDPSFARQVRTVQLRMVVDDEGKVQATALVRSAEPAVNREALRVAQRMRFRPAHLGEYPIHVLVEIPVTFNFPAPAPPPSPGPLGAGPPRP